MSSQYTISVRPEVKKLVATEVELMDNSNKDSTEKMVASECIKLGLPLYRQQWQATVINVARNSPLTARDGN
jgi:hypothetical protein